MTSGRDEPVLVVHGLGRTPASMAVLTTRLRKAGHDVLSFGYPSRSEPMESLVDRLGSSVERRAPGATTSIHFVTHSMGGVLVRSYLGARPARHAGRVVMLSPPNRGSEIVDAFAESAMLRRLLGPAGARLGTGPNSIPNRLGPVDFELGVITGSRSIDPIGSWLIPGPDDGKVSVERARVDGAADFLVVPATHTFIMNRSDVAHHVAHFLRHGHFDRSGTGTHE
ncbi:MAG: alpha/beta hydrolase [Gemmatimonadetes bacterium]|nr:alpha/beta hydrolase [Gemmatimonadota bacterium]